jgi:hypothetical protein
MTIDVFNLREPKMRVGMCGPAQGDFKVRLRIKAVRYHWQCAQWRKDQELIKEAKQIRGIEK